MRNSSFLFVAATKSVALYGSEKWTIGKSEERVVNALETWSWRRMSKIK
jgi:hypothetical protein